MSWKCPECENSNEDYLARCVCGFDVESEKLNHEPQMIETNRMEKASESQSPNNDTKISLFSFTGRIRRSTFWAITAPLFLISFGLQVTVALSADSGVSGELVVLALIYFIPAIWLALATYVKRWHDLNMSGWMVLTLFIPFVNFLILLYLGFAPGTAGTNKYGEEPQKRA
jgi:uncharacterized membrane protein YhaH (DUF805 family)